MAKNQTQTIWIDSNEILALKIFHLRINREPKFFGLTETQRSADRYFSNSNSNCADRLICLNIRFICMQAHARKPLEFMQRKIKRSMSK